MQIRRCECKRCDDFSPAETIWFSHLKWSCLPSSAVERCRRNMFEYVRRFPVRNGCIMGISIKCVTMTGWPKSADSSLRKATWNCSRSFVQSRRLPMRRRVAATCFEARCWSYAWSKLVVRNRIALIQFVGSPFGLPTKKKEPYFFRLDKRCELDYEIDHSLLLWVFPRKN